MNSVYCNHCLIMSKNMLSSTMELLEFAQNCNERYWWHQPVILRWPVLWEGVNSFSTGLNESGIKLGQFRIVTASKSVNWMWTPRVIKMEKHHVMERIIAVKINNLTEKISLRILITRQPGELYLAWEVKRNIFKTMSCNSLTILPAWMILKTFLLTAGYKQRFGLLKDCQRLQEQNYCNKFSPSRRLLRFFRGPIFCDKLKQNLE